MMAKPMKTLQLHYPMIQFLIMGYLTYICRGILRNLNASGPIVVIGLPESNLERKREKKKEIKAFGMVKII